VTGQTGCRLAVGCVHARLSMPLKYMPCLRAWTWRRAINFQGGPHCASGLVCNNWSTLVLPRGGGGGVERCGTIGAGLVGGVIDRSTGEATRASGAVCGKGLKMRSSRIGLRSFMWACPIYRSNSSLLAWRRIACWSASGSLLTRRSACGRSHPRPHCCSRPGPSAFEGRPAVGRGAS
jgi:hypothetical protein